ncbi:MAG: DUF4198 domain-containing protein [Desulfatitalea sp.]
MIPEMIPDVVRGHEVWLEHITHNRSDGKTLECKLLFGHNMAVDGVADVTAAQAVLIDPRNVKHRLEIAAADGGLIGTFTPTLEGNHIVAAEYDAGIYTVTEDGWHKGPKKDFINVKRSGYYYQYAKTIIAGHGAINPTPTIGQELEIINTGAGHYHAWDTVVLQVLYDGAALSGGVVTAAVSGSKGNGIDVAIGMDGMTSITLDRPGNWMFKVRHADPRKGVEELYDEKVTTSVFTIMGVH